MRDYDLNLISRYRNELFGAAAISILIFHYSYDVWASVNRGLITRADSPVYPAMLLYYAFIRSVGVEIFLFLSGMGLYYSLEGNRSLKRFYARRLTRVLFPYLVLGTAFWVLRDVVLRGESWVRVIDDLSFVSFFREGQHMIWFVCFIVIMYLVYPAVHRFLDVGNRALGFLMLLLVSVALPVFLRMTAYPFYENTEIALLRVPVFITGAFAGKYIRGHRRVPLPAMAAVILSCLVLRAATAFRDPANAVEARLTACAWSLGLIALLALLFHLLPGDGRVRRFFAKAGSYSLELYLVHVSVRNIMKNMHLRFWEPKYFLLLVAVSVPLSVMLGGLVSAAFALRAGNGHSPRAFGEPVPRADKG